MRKKIRDMIYISFFSIILAICSWISIPMVVPFTLGTLGVFLAILLLGGKRGMIAIGLYILLGVVGLPVFAGFRGGVGVLLGNTGGYIWGYLVIAGVMWILERWTKRNKLFCILSMLIGLIGCYVCGTVWFMKVYASEMEMQGMLGVLVVCVFPYVVPDFIKIVLAYILSKRIKMVIDI